MQIKNHFTNAVIFEDSSKTIFLTVENAVKNGANLYGANLYGANLGGANLRSANLGDANLYGANLGGANLKCANLGDANLGDANLYGANLGGANLKCANLRSANLGDANLYGADLKCANLGDADLYGADLYGADLRSAKILKKEIESIYSSRKIVAAGELIVYKKLKGGVISTLKIPADAKRVGGLTGRKCRAEYAIVLEGEGISSHDAKTIYKVGEMVKPDSYDPNPLVECAPGIHFFISREEAENY